MIATAAGAQVEHVTFAYDAFDRRVAKTTAGSNPSTRYTVYDGQNPLADFDASGNVTAVHLHADAVDALLASVAASGGVSWYLTDNQGSVRSVLNAAGSVVDRITYDAFGGVASETNPSAGGRFKYTSREWDGEIGLQYNRARYYDPSTGRWISQDPIGFAGGDANLYRYVGNSPTNATDPSGLKYQATGADGQVSAGSQIQASPSGSSGSSGVQDSGTPDYQSFLGFDPSALEPRSDTSPRRRKLAWDPFPSSAERLRIQTDQLQFGVGFVSSIVGSAAEMAGGAAVAYASGGLGSALGSGLVADGFDNLQATLFQRKTAKYQAVQSLTGSESLATLTEIGVPIALGLATSIPGVRSVGRGGGGPIAALDAVDTGRLGGRLYDLNKLGRLERYLDRRSVTLRVGDEFLPPRKAGGFLARPDGTAELLLRSNPTEYEVWHELSHYIQWKQVGPARYLELPRWTRSNPIQDLPEQFVFDLLENSKVRRWDRLSPEQQQHAIDYLLGNPDKDILGKGGIR